MNWSESTYITYCVQTKVYIKSKNRSILLLHYSSLSWKINIMVSSEAAVQRCSVKKAFLEISQNSEENTCAKVSFLIKLQALAFRPATWLKKRLWDRCFPVNFTKCLRTPLFIEHPYWLLLFRNESNSAVCSSFIWK